MSESLPTVPLKDAELIGVLNRGFKAEPATEVDGSKKRNLDRAREELGHIAALKSNPAFNWFFDNCVESAFMDARKDLENAPLGSGDLPLRHAQFRALRKIVRWLDEREIEHRRLDDPNDPALDALRARIGLH
jgi:hypothetical protein